MTGAAENIATPDKGPGLLGCEFHMARLPLTRLHIEAQLADADSMRHVEACEFQLHGLAFLQRDLGGFEAKSLRRNCNGSPLHLGRRWTAKNWNAGDQEHASGRKCAFQFHGSPQSSGLIAD